MKLGKNKEVSSDNKSGKTSASSPKASSSGLTSPVTYSVIAAFVGVVSVVLVALGIYTAILTPGQSLLERDRNTVSLKAAASVFSLQLRQVESMVSHFAKNLPQEQVAASEEFRQAQELAAINAMPGTLRVVISPMGRAARDDQQPLPVSFASLDLIRSVEQTAKGRLEAFVVNDHWYLQVVMPIVSTSGQIGGTLLAMFDAGILSPDWKMMPSGGLALLQSVAGAERVVISHGSAGDKAANTLTMDTSLPNWSVSYSPGNDISPLLDVMTFWILVATGALVSGVLAALVITMYTKLVRRDVGLVSGYVRANLQGEKVPVPKIKLNLLHSMVVLVSQAKKPAKTATVVKVDKPATVETAAKVTSKAAAKKVVDELADAEPLFQGDSLDIDMLGEDDDLLGLNDDDLGLNEDEDMVVNEAAMVDIDEQIFRAYDIRGVVDQNLSPHVMREIGKAYGSEALKRGMNSVCVGYDGRYSSPTLAQEFTKGILATGVNVINVGMVPTPVLYFATHHLNTGSGAMITGSHNPSNYNGIKMMLAGDTLAEKDIQALLQRIRTQSYATGQGVESDIDVQQDYLDAIVGDIAVAAPLKVVVDAGNGVAGILGPRLIEELGCDVVPLYCEIDGRFPNHHPDPGNPANLQDLIAKVAEVGADIGIAFDGDGDRIGVVTGQGKIIWPDRLLMLFAKDVVSRNPGSDVIFDVKCSRRLNGLISSVGGRPVMWKTGHSLIKAKMKETGALLAGEMSGHIFFKERWLGFDDGLYSAARLLEILGIDERDADTMFDEFPEDISTPEINVEVGETAKFHIMEQLIQKGSWGDANVSNIDGVRVEYSDGWGLCRASNTTPVLVLRFEAETEDALERIQSTFRTQLQSIDLSLEVPF